MPGPRPTRRSGDSAGGHRSAGVDQGQPGGAVAARAARRVEIPKKAAMEDGRIWLPSTMMEMASAAAFNQRRDYVRSQCQCELKDRHQKSKQKTNVSDKVSDEERTESTIEP